jgi:hypothetical protein
VGPTSTKTKAQLVRKVAASGGPQPLIRADRRTGASRVPAGQDGAPADDRMTIYLPREDHKWLRRQALEQDTTLSALIRELVRQYRQGREGLHDA